MKWELPDFFSYFSIQSIFFIEIFFSLFRASCSLEIHFSLLFHCYFSLILALFPFNYGKQAQLFYKLYLIVLLSEISEDLLLNLIFQLMLPCFLVCLINFDYLLLIVLVKVSARVLYGLKWKDLPRTLAFASVRRLERHYQLRTVL